MTSDLAAESASDPAANSEERFTKSENFAALREGGVADQRGGGGGNWSPTLWRLRNSLRSRLSLTRRRDPTAKTSQRVNTSSRNTLTVPLLAPRQWSEEGVDGERNGEPKTAPRLEERFVRQRERGRGSFVVVRIKSPGPEGLLEEDYLKRLEENYRLNHTFGSLSVDLEESMCGLIRQGQVRVRIG